MVNHPSDEELRALKESIIFPFVLTIFDRDKKAIEQSNLKFQKPYLELVERAEKRAHICMVNNKKFLRNRGIKVYEEIQTDLDITIKYMCRGYHDQAIYMLNYLKGETELRIKFYLNEETAL